MSAYTFSDATLLYAKHFDVIAQVQKLAAQDLAKFADALTSAIEKAVAPRELQTYPTSRYRYWYLAPEFERGVPKTPCLYSELVHSEVPHGKLTLWGYCEQGTADMLARARASATAAKATLPPGCELDVGDSGSGWTKDHVLELRVSYGREPVLDEVAAPIAMLLLAISSNAEVELKPARGRNPR